MRIGAAEFHVFLGAHSLLIGLLPFYLPVWLWREGLGLAGLALLIATSGLAFAAALAPWGRQATRRPARTLVATGLALELGLVGLAAALAGGAVATSPLGAALALGIANGLYNAWFWTTQRLLFAARLGANDAGRRYGGFQVYVAVTLKVGLVVGGVALEAGGFGWLLALSLGVAIAAGAWLHPRLPTAPLLSRPAPPTSAAAPALPGWRASLRRTDRHGARPTFALDGVFLFLESHFWTLSLFLLAGEDYAALGIWVVALGIVFGALFWLVRGAIDRVRPAAVYRVAVALYAASWALRAVAPDAAGGPWLGPLLVAVTFCTSLFRLAFNKRFFEHARASGDVAGYLLWKSHVSQTALGAAFAGVALTLALGPGDPTRLLGALYAIAAVAALAYLAWRPAPAPSSATGAVLRSAARPSAPT